MKMRSFPLLPQLFGRVSYFELLRPTCWRGGDSVRNGDPGPCMFLAWDTRSTP